MPIDFPTAVNRIKNDENITTITTALQAQLTPPERLTLLDGDAPFWPGLHDLTQGTYNNRPWPHGSISRLNIPGLQFTDGPRGLVLGHATAFPVPMARGATWDTSLEERVGHAIGLEARTSGANLLGSTCINLPRHPAWGRAQEVYGEDTVLLGEMGAAHVTGVQHNTMACVKHYALNSMENARFKVDVRVDPDVLRTAYLPHFRRVVEAGAASLMTAYNAVNGEWAGHNRVLLTDILREEWGFSGFTISDWVFGVRDGVLSLRNGLDVEAPFANLRARWVPGALEGGEISWADVDRAGFRVLSSLLRLYASRDAHDPTRDVILSQEHLALAREVANRSIVLLKNDPPAGSNQPLLPLHNPSGLALIGRLARSKNTGDQGSSMVTCPGVITPHEALEHALPPTCPLTLSDTDSVTDAVNAASSAETVLVIVGYDGNDEGEFLAPAAENTANVFDQIFPPTDGSKEAAFVSSLLDNGASALEGRTKGGDRINSIRLRERDVELINAVTSVNPRTVVAMVTGSAVITEEWRHKVPSLLVSWYNGVQGASALAGVLMGEVNPSGRLPWCMPRDEEHLPFFDPDAETISYDEWFGQRGVDKQGVETAYPFGFGISYTSFRFTNLRLSPSSEPDSFTITVDVTNTGPREGRCIIQVYGRPSTSQSPYQPRSLLGFTPIDLLAQETRHISCRASIRPLQRWSPHDGLGFGGGVGVEVGRFAGDGEACVGEYYYSV